MTDSRIKIEVHLIQNFAPSNLNRDDTGQPKDATFGGFRRARISSQCSKRSIRQLWRENGTVPIGERTKLLKAKLAPMLQAEGRTDEQIAKALDKFLAQFYSKMDKEKTAVLLFVSQAELDECVKVINDNWDVLSSDKDIEKKAADSIRSRITKAETSADIALFGRMLAEQPGRNTDGSCQVAHPISTHKVDMEMDFFTAVDDLNPVEETGAGMMGVVGFNSACYYRYALVDRDTLARNLARKTERKGGKWTQALEQNDYIEADKVIQAFLEAMVYAIPTGKQNSFAAQNLPSFGLFIARQGGVPISLANAFATPVRIPHRTKEGELDEDLVGLSVSRLTEHWETLGKVYGDQGVVATSSFNIVSESRLNGLKNSDKGSVDGAITAVMEAYKGAK